MDKSIYGFSVLQYEKDGTTFCDPAHLWVQSLACFATHDAPSVNGFCKGRNIDRWQQLGRIHKSKAHWLRGERVDEVSELAPAHQEPTRTLHIRPAQSPFAMTAVQLDDVFSEVEAQNLPSTIVEHPNLGRVSEIEVGNPKSTPTLNQ